MNFLGNENLSPKSNESNNVYTVYIRSEIQYSLLNTWCLFAKSLHFRGLALKVHGKATEHLLHLWGLRSVLGKSRVQWKPWSACCSCSRFPSILVPCCAEMPDLMERQWIDSAWRPLSTKISTPKKTKLILGSAGMGGNEMEWGNESQWYPKEGWWILIPYLLGTNQKNCLKCKRGHVQFSMDINMVSVSASKRLRFVALTTELQDIFWSMRHAWKHLSTTWIHVGNTRQQISRWQNHAKPFQHDGSCSRTLPPLLVVGRDHSSQVHGLRDSITARHDCLWHCNFSENILQENSTSSPSQLQVYISKSYQFHPAEFPLHFALEPHGFRLIRSSARLCTSEWYLHLKSQLPRTKLWEAL